jgi:hypothetical protein
MFTPRTTHWASLYAFFRSLRKDPLLLTTALEKRTMSKAAPRRQQILDAERDRVIAAYRAQKTARRELGQDDHN